MDDLIQIKKYICFEKGKAPKETFDLPAEGLVPYLSPEYLRNVGKPLYVKPSKKLTSIEEGEIIILWDGSNAGEIFISKSGVLASTMTKIVFDENEFDKKYFGYALKYNEYFLKAKTAGSGIPHVDKGIVKKLQIFKPNKTEQRTIASILTQVDEAIGATKNSIAKAERLKKALMQNLLTGKLKADGSRRREDEFYLDEKFGKVPKGWKVRRLDDVFFVNQETLSTKTKPDYTFNYITIEATFTERIEWSLVSKEIFKDAPSRARRIIKEGDILLSTVRPNLKSFLIFNKPKDIDGDWICSTGFGVLTPKENQDRNFYFFQILSEIGEKQFYRFVAGTNYPAINDRDFKRILFYEAPFEEQKIIGKKISKVSYFISTKQSKINKLERLKKGLMQNLLSGRVRVKVAEPGFVG